MHPLASLFNGQWIQNKTLLVCENSHIGKVSTRFEFFASGFAFRLGFALYLIGLYAELNSASNGAIFD